MSQRKPHPGGKRPSFTQREIERIHDMRDAGLTLKEIGSFVGSSANTVGLLLRGVRAAAAAGAARPVRIGGQEERQ